MFSKKKKILSTLTILAVAATATLGGLSFVGGSPAPFDIANADTTVVNKTSEADATKYYVGTPADGAAATGTTPEDPMDFTKFANEVVSVLKPGDIVRVMPGEHKINFTITLNVSGSYDDYIIFEAQDPSQKTVLNFSGQYFASTSRGVQINGNYYYWQGIDICGAGDNGMYIGGSYNVVEDCEFYNNRDTGLQLGRSFSEYTSITQWPSYNYIKNCTSHNNYDNETYGENADGFAAKLTVGYHNVFDGCIAYRNSDDGWDLYGKVDSGIIGTVIMYNCIAFENGYLEYTQAECNAFFGDTYDSAYNEANTNTYLTRDGDGNGFKLGGSTLEGDVIMNNCIAFNNRMHGVTDNSNPGVISLTNVTSYNNSAIVDDIPYTAIVDVKGNTNSKYVTVDVEDYILDSEDHRIIVESVSGALNKVYASLDEEGYILDKDGNKLDDKGNAISEENDNLSAQPVKGEYIKIDKQASTVNANFGMISGCNTECNNIDIARSEDSYNNFSGVLSVFNGRTGSGEDAYIGSAEDSLLVSGTKWNKIDGILDANTYMDKNGESVDAASASDIFAELPANNIGVDRSLHVHTAWRDSDGNIALGNLLKIKDYSVLGFEAGSIGADLSAVPAGGYPVPDYTYLTDDSITSEQAALAEALRQTVYIPVKLDAVYQDFELVTSLSGVNIQWASSDESVISIGTDETVSQSNTRKVYATVYRAADKDTEVTLTATIGDTGVKREFKLNVVKNEFLIGDILAEDVVDDTLIVEQFSLAEKPAVSVQNAADYNGKLLPEDAYTVETTYYYAQSKGLHQVEVAGFSPSNAGVYTITEKVACGSQSGEYSYTVYVVSGDADVDFTSAPTISVNYQGFSIVGDLNNVAGTLYAMAATSEPTVEQLVEQGQSYQIVSDSVNAQFTADNSQAYTVYYVVCNPNGDATSEIYSKAIQTVEISTPQQFADLAKSGGDPANIYKLTADLDFADFNWSIGESSFKALLDGQGHKISNITAKSSSNGLAAVFYRLEDGSVMNITFENIVLEGVENVGIFGSAYGGYISNLKLNNVSAVGKQRIAALIGRVYEQPGMDLVIDRVSLVNDSEHKIYGAGSSSARAAGIIGFMQPNGTPKSYKVNVTITNCFVDAIIGSATTKENGGIVAVWDDGYMPAVESSLTIDMCYFAGTVIADSRCGGIVGYQKGMMSMSVTNCISDGDIYHAGSTTPIITAEKNASGIFGGYNTAANAFVRNCYARFEDHNTNYEVMLIDDTLLPVEGFWKNTLKFDTENIWQFDADSEYYVTLR